MFVRPAILGYSTFTSSVSWVTEVEVKGEMIESYNGLTGEHPTLGRYVEILKPQVGIGAWTHISSGGKRVIRSQLPVSKPLGRPWLHTLT